MWLLLSLLLILNNLRLEFLLSVDSLLDLIKEALRLWSTGVECVWSGLRLLLLWWLSLLELWLLWLLLLLWHKLGLLLPPRLLVELILWSSWLTLEAVEGGSGGRRCPNRSGPGLGPEPPVVAGSLLLVDAADVDVPGEAGHGLAVPGVGDDLGHATVAGRVPAQDGLGRPVPLAADGPGTSVTPVPGLAEISLIIITG